MTIINLEEVVPCTFLRKDVLKTGLLEVSGTPFYYNQGIRWQAGLRQCYFAVIFSRYINDMSHLEQR